MALNRRNTAAYGDGMAGGAMPDINQALTAQRQQLGRPVGKPPMGGRRGGPGMPGFGQFPVRPGAGGAGGSMGGVMQPPGVGKPQVPPAGNGGPWQQPQPGLPVGDPPWMGGGQSPPIIGTPWLHDSPVEPPQLPGGPHQFPINPPQTVQLPPELMSQDPTAPPMMPPSGSQQPIEMPPVGAPPPQLPSTPPVVGNNFQGQHGGTQALGGGRYGGAPPADVLARRRNIQGRIAAATQGAMGGK